jgi:hypothetical protein
MAIEERERKIVLNINEGNEKMVQLTTNKSAKIVATEKSRSDFVFT